MIKNVSICVVVWIALSMFPFPVISLAANDQPLPQTKPTTTGNSWIVNGEDVQGKWWWTKNSKTMTNQTSPWLYHFDVKYSYSGLSGNIDADRHQGAATLALRKQFFTSTSLFSISKNETSVAISGVSIEVESQKMIQVFSYSLTDWMEFEAGVVWRKNDSIKYIDNRIEYFFGPQMQIIDIPKLSLSVGGYYGYSDTAYLNEMVTMMYQDFSPVEDYSDNGILLKQMLMWHITPTVTFTENAAYVQYFENTDYYHWKVQFDLEFEMTKHFSFISTYKMDYDYNVFVEDVQNYLDDRRENGQLAGEMKELDTIVSIGIKIDF